MFIFQRYKISTTLTNNLLERCQHFTTVPTYVIVSIGGYDTDKDGRPDITFAKSGQFFGSTGCNRYFGQYLSEGPDIEVVGNVGMTRMYCHNQAEQEQLLAREIVKIKKFEVRGNRLTLTTEDGLKIEGVRAK